MISTYTASPTVIDKADLSHVGSGTSIARYGHGMYFGEPDTVNAYLDNYRHYGKAAVSITSAGICAFEGEDAFDEMKRVYDDPDCWPDVRDEWLCSPALVEIAEQYSVDETPDFTIKRGVAHAVSLRNIDESNLMKWDDPAPEEVRKDVQMALLERHYKVHPSPDIPWRLFSDPPTPEPGASAEDVIEHIIQAAIHRAYEEDTIGFGVDDTALEEAGWKLALKVDVSYDDKPEGFDEVFDEVAKMALAAFVAPGVEMDHYLSYGDMYELVASGLSETPGIPENKAASAIMVDVGIIGFQGDAIEGAYGRKEYVVFDERVLADAKFEVIPPDEWDKTLEMQALEPALDDDPAYRPSRGY